MDIWKSLIDKLAPLLIAFAAGEMASELSAVFAGLIGRATRLQSIARVLWHSWFLFITTKIRLRLLALAIIPIGLSMGMLFLAKRWCGGSFPVPWQIYLWPSAALLYVMLGMFRSWLDMPAATVPTDVLDGRVGKPEVFSRYSLEQQEREFESAGIRPRSQIIVEVNSARLDLAAAKRTGNAEEITRLQDLVDRLDQELQEHTAFERQLRMRAATQPLMSDAEFARALDPYRPLDRSPLPHLIAMSYELLIAAFLLLGADLTLGWFSFDEGGVNLAFPILIGLCGFAVFLLWAVAFWIAVVVPSEGIETAATTPAKPITAVYHLVVQILPFIDDKNVADRAGSFTGATITKLRDHLKSFGTLFRSKMSVVYIIGLVLPHPFAAFCGLLMAIVTGVTRTNKEVEGLDTKAERQADATRMHTFFSWALVTVLGLIFVLTFERTLVADLLTWFAEKLNAILHPISMDRPSDSLRGSNYFLAWVGYILRVILLSGVAVLLMVAGNSWLKGKTAYKPKFGVAMMVFGAIMLANVVITVPHITDSTSVQSLRAMLLCPVPPTNVADVTTLVATPSTVAVSTATSASAPEAATPSAGPAVVPQTSSSESSRRHRRRTSDGVRVAGVRNEGLRCPNAANLTPCDEGIYSDPAEVAVFRLSCLCR